MFMTQWFVAPKTPIIMHFAKYCFTLTTFKLCLLITNVASFAHVLIVYKIIIILILTSMTQWNFMISKQIPTQCAQTSCVFSKQQAFITKHFTLAIFRNTTQQKTPK